MSKRTSIFSFRRLFSSSSCTFLFLSRCNSLPEAFPLDSVSTKTDLILCIVSKNNSHPANMAEHARTTQSKTKVLLQLNWGGSHCTGCVQRYWCHYLSSTVHLQISSSDLQCSSQEVHTQDPAPPLWLSDPTKRDEKVKKQQQINLHTHPMKSG